MNSDAYRTLVGHMKRLVEEHGASGWPAVKGSEIDALLSFCDQAEEVMRGALLRELKTSRQLELEKERSDKLAITNKIVEEKSFECIAENQRLKEELKIAATEPISQRCRRTHLQCCHFCDDPDCGDNTSPLKAKVERLKTELRWYANPTHYRDGRAGTPDAVELPGCGYTDIGWRADRGDRARSALKGR